MFAVIMTALLLITSEFIKCMGLAADISQKQSELEFVVQLKETVINDKEIIEAKIILAKDEILNAQADLTEAESRQNSLLDEVILLRKEAEETKIRLLAIQSKIDVRYELIDFIEEKIREYDAVCKLH